MNFNFSEPSSVLANRVMHALDNPSPPPSPSLPLSFFDPYHTTSPQSPTDYQNDLFSLGMDSRPERDNDNPLLLPATNNSKAQSFDSLLHSPAQVIQQDLISFDSVPIEPSKEVDSSLLLKESVLINDCPIPVNFLRVQQPFEIPDLVVDPPLQNLVLDSVTPMDLSQTVDIVEGSDVVLHNSEPQTEIGRASRRERVSSPV